MKRKNESKQNVLIKVKSFLYMLKCVYLGGVIDEVVATFKGKKCFINAVDITNNICVITSGKISKDKIEEKEFGFGNVDTLIKFLNTSRDDQMNMSEKKDNILSFSSLSGNRSMKYISTVPSMIPTIMEDENTEDDFLKMQSYKMPLTREVMQDFKSYISLCGTTQTEVKYNDGNLSIVIGSDIENQFTIAFETKVEILNTDGGDKFSIMINGNYLEKIFSVIDFNDENPPCIYVCDSDKPVFVQSPGVLWGILPIGEETQTEDGD